MTKTYELGNYIGCGAFSAFFHIKDHPLLGVKIRFDNHASYSPSLLKRELNKARILRAIDIPIPRFAGIIQIRIPENYHEILEKKKEFIHKKYWSELEALVPGKVYPGLSIEIIDHDISMIKSTKLIDIYSLEKAKLLNYGIRIGADSSSDNNVLWSRKYKKMFFIDFDFWFIPDKLEKIEESDWVKKHQKELKKSDADYQKYIRT